MGKDADNPRMARIFTDRPKNVNRFEQKGAKDRKPSLYVEKSIHLPGGLEDADVPQQVPYLEIFASFCSILSAFFRIDEDFSLFKKTRFFPYIHEDPFHPCHPWPVLFPLKFRPQ